MLMRHLLFCLSPARSTITGNSVYLTERPAKTEIESWRGFFLVSHVSVVRPDIASSLMSEPYGFLSIYSHCSVSTLPPTAVSPCHKVAG
ncbi:hypothetical protein CEXT_469391 [Caerostris extrusa]|uniref:Secreted protein n=1 Tax=Caerostris extrusa TaxID=172846 RepID=A0AAV4WM80_CAEEX|nr:hypothetical protein CEXT_469391 [Caerostris extrusa]